MKFSHGGKVTGYMEVKSLPLASKILSLMKITQPDKVTPQEELHSLTTEFCVAKFFVF